MAQFDPKITILEMRVTIGNELYVEGMMEADAEKPTENIAGGSMLFDFENGVAYFYKKSAGQWVDCGGE